jgi:hypothetical protein
VGCSGPGGHAVERATDGSLKVDTSTQSGLIVAEEAHDMTQLMVRLSTSTLASPRNRIHR